MGSAVALGLEGGSVVWVALCRCDWVGLRRWDWWGGRGVWWPCALGIGGGHVVMGVSGVGGVSGGVEPRVCCDLV